MDYDFELHHKPGKTMIPADALSRRHDHSLVEEDSEVVGLPEDLFIRLLDLDLQSAVKSGQDNDPTAQDALQRLQDATDRPNKWTIEAGPENTRCLFYNGKMYVPDDLNLRRKIVVDHHDSEVAGYPGALATSRSVCLSYWWPGMAMFIRRYVAGCAVCQQFKVNTHPTKPSLFPIPSGSS